jgi:hypothetical protein
VGSSPTGGTRDSKCSTKNIGNRIGDSSKENRNRDANNSRYAYYKSMNANISKSPATAVVPETVGSHQNSCKNGEKFLRKDEKIALGISKVYCWLV